MSDANIAFVITLSAATIFYFFFTLKTGRPWLSCFLTVVMGNVIVMIQSYDQHGSLSSWWQLGHFFLTLILLLACFFGFMGWVLYKIKAEDNSDDNNS